MELSKCRARGNLPRVPAAAVQLATRPSLRAAWRPSG